MKQTIEALRTGVFPAPRGKVVLQRKDGLYCLSAGGKLIAVMGKRFLKKIQQGK